MVNMVFILQLTIEKIYTSYINCVDVFCFFSCKQDNPQICSSSNTQSAEDMCSKIINPGGPFANYLTEVMYL